VFPDSAAARGDKEVAAAGPTPPNAQADLLARALKGVHW
jgi:hypothetical protein